jgi:hypothetical protein
MCWENPIKIQNFMQCSVGLSGLLPLPGAHLLLHTVHSHVLAGSRYTTVHTPVYRCYKWHLLEWRRPVQSPVVVQHNIALRPTLHSQQHMCRVCAAAVVHCSSLRHSRSATSPVLRTRNEQKTYTTPSTCTYTVLDFLFPTLRPHSRVQAWPAYRHLYLLL